MEVNLSNDCGEFWKKIEQHKTTVANKGKINFLFLMKLK